mmetsp:Transcript_2781/g.10161  ORF Transcript_2781/g.10161 Transcript_2781/m.10161 type:complete len:89 (-) Transcript_2781:181-447(-)
MTPFPRRAWATHAVTQVQFGAGGMCCGPLGAHSEKKWVYPPSTEFWSPVPLALLQVLRLAVEKDRLDMDRLRMKSECHAEAGVIATCL